MLAIALREARGGTGHVISSKTMIVFPHYESEDSIVGKCIASTHKCMHTQAELEHLGHTPGVNPTFLTPSSPPSLTPSHPHTTPPLTTHQSLTVQDVECEQKGATEVKGVEGGGTEATILPLIPPSNIQDRHPQNLFVSTT